MADSSTRPRPRKAVGPARPTYLRPEDIDKVMAVVLALMSEVSALRDRVDTHERLALGGVPPTPAAVDAFQPDEAVDAERESRREAYVKRLLRVVLEETETVVPAEPLVLTE
jgi:hypothetical protein